MHQHHHVNASPLFSTAEKHGCPCLGWPAAFRALLPAQRGMCFTEGCFVQIFSVTAMTESSHKSHQLSLLLTRAL